MIPERSLAIATVVLEGMVGVELLMLVLSKSSSRQGKGSSNPFDVLANSGALTKAVWRGGDWRGLLSVVGES